MQARGSLAYAPQGWQAVILSIYLFRGRDQHRQQRTPAAAKPSGRYAGALGARQGPTGGRTDALRGSPGGSGHAPLADRPWG